MQRVLGTDRDQHRVVSFGLEVFIDNVMIDIETLGTRPGSVILSIGAVRFNPSAGDADPMIGGKTFYRSIDVFDSLMHGLTVDPVTCKWWSNQDPASLGAVCNATHDLKPALHALSVFINHDDYVWAKGPDFDLVLLEAAYIKVGLKRPWNYRNTRDVRTILHIGQLHQVGNVKDMRTLGHHALQDAIHQAKQVNKVYRALDIDTTKGPVDWHDVKPFPPFNIPKR